jgi:hypothetical protein
MIVLGSQIDNAGGYRLISQAVGGIGAGSKRFDAHDNPFREMYTGVQFDLAVSHRASADHRLYSIGFARQDTVRSFTF